MILSSTAYAADYKSYMYKIITLLEQIEENTSLNCGSVTSEVKDYE
jgi:hypothetical protein